MGPKQFVSANIINSCLRSYKNLPKDPFS